MEVFSWAVRRDLSGSGFPPENFPRFCMDISLSLVSLALVMKIHSAMSDFKNALFTLNLLRILDTTRFPDSVREITP